MTDLISLHVCVLGGPTLWRLGLQALLTGQPNLAQVTQAASPIQVGDPPNVILLDGRSVDEFLPSLLTAFPQTNLLIIADELNESTVMAWLEKGIRGCLERDASLPALLNAIRQVAAGEASLPQPLVVRLVTRLAGQSSAPTEMVLPETLSEREREVLILLARGLSNKEIAQRLYLSVRTVEGHLANIYSKLGVHSRTEAALYAVQQGWTNLTR
ncbi:MAG: DNA-binding response regulator [Anaerolineae bacterium]|nr:DNA-binding response regulator [Anaerolineae bacterium]